MDMRRKGFARQRDSVLNWAVGSLLVLVALTAASAVIPSKLMPPEGSRTQLFFDGVCNLCDGFVNFVADHDAAKRIQFGAIQKHTELIERVGGPTDLSTVVLVQGDKYYTHSTAVLRTLAMLDVPWCYMSLMAVVPSPVRDICYRFVARHRYQFFGRVPTCRLPTESFKSRFIENEATSNKAPDFLRLKEN